jgi:hypothetical protein
VPPAGANGFEITGGSLSSIMSHGRRAGVNAVIAYESLPKNYLEQFLSFLKKG